MIEVAAIDCAEEKNMPSCRDFEIMGYPTMKLLPPMARLDQISTYQDVKGHEVAPIKEEMESFVAKLRTNSTYFDQVRDWPMFAPFQ